MKILVKTCGKKNGFTIKKISPPNFHRNFPYLWQVAAKEWPQIGIELLNFSPGRLKFKLHAGLATTCLRIGKSGVEILAVVDLLERQILSESIPLTVLLSYLSWKFSSRYFLFYIICRYNVFVNYLILYFF